MAKQFETKMINAHALYTLFSSLEPNEIVALKPPDVMRAIKYVSKLKSELEGAVGDYDDLLGRVDSAVTAALREYQAKSRDVENNPELSEDSKKRKIAVLNVEASDCLQEKRDAVSLEVGLQESGDEMVQVRIDSDDRFVCLKDLFQKIVAGELKESKKNLRSLEMVGEIQDALDGAKEL